MKAGNEKDIQYINGASEILIEISDKEKSNEYSVKCMSVVDFLIRFTYFRRKIYPRNFYAFMIKIN